MRAKWCKGIAPNVATVTFNNDPNKGTQNKYSRKLFLLNQIKVEQDGKDVDGRNDGKRNAYSSFKCRIWSTISSHTKWHTNVDIASDHYKQFSIQDPVEDRLTYKEGSARVIDMSTGKILLQKVH